MNDLAELKRLLAEATEAPWQATREAEDETPPLTPPLWLVATSGGVVGDLFAEKNARLIALLRNLAPQMIAVIEAALNMRDRPVIGDHTVALYAALSALEGEKGATE